MDTKFSFDLYWEVNQLCNKKIDIAEYLDSKEMIAEYLNTALEEGNESEILVAIGNVATSDWYDENCRRNGYDSDTD